MVSPKSQKTARLRGKRIRLHPTPDQEVLFWRSAGTARWAFNYFLSEQEKAYEEYLKRGKTGRKSISEGAVRKQINNELKPTTHQWLREVGSNVMKQAVKEANKAFQKYLAGLIGKPKFKSKHRTKPSFYVNYESLSRKNGGFHGEKIGFVRTAEPLPKIPRESHYANPWISFDGKYWYLSLSYEICEQVDNNLTGDFIGIDLGIKHLAVCYAIGANKFQVYPNINKTGKVHRLERRLKREQRKQSRKLEMKKQISSEGKVLLKQNLQQCQNLERQRRKLVLLHRRLRNIRNNYLHQVTSAIVKTKPSRIVIEDLHVMGMMKNRHLAKAIAAAKFHEFRRQLQYKCEMHGIQLVVADRFFPSSKKCSGCGHIHSTLRLKERTYHCPACGKTLDRDFNAAINLANYVPLEPV